MVSHNPSLDVAFFPRTECLICSVRSFHNLSNINEQKQNMHLPIHAQVQVEQTDY